MRGHGATVAGRNIRHAVYVSVYLEVNARLQKQAMDMGEVRFLTAGEVDKVARAPVPTASTVPGRTGAGAPAAGFQVEAELADRMGRARASHASGGDGSIRTASRPAPR